MKRKSRRQFLKHAVQICSAGSFAGCIYAGNGDQSQSPEALEIQTQTAGSREEKVQIIGGEASKTSCDKSSEGTYDSIQEAIKVAKPGDTVLAPPGTYREKIKTVRSGTKRQPITITGPESAVICGNQDKYGILRIRHSHVHFRGFTVEGLLDRQRPKHLSSFVRGQLIQTRPPKTRDSYLRDIVIAPHNIGYSRKSLIGLERTVNAEIGPSRVTGLAGANYILGDNQSHNGELLYIGTSPSNLGTEWHPWTELDRTRDIRIHHIDNSEGNAHAEAVDLKEGTRDVIIEFLTDRNGGHVRTDDTPAAISFKSHKSTVRWSVITDVPVGVEFDASHPDLVYGNDLYYCRIENIDKVPLFFESDTVGPHVQGTLCGNRIEGSDDLQPAPCDEDVPNSETIGFNGGRTTS